MRGIEFVPAQVAIKRESTSVSVDGLHPALLPHLFRLDHWCRDHLGYELVITSSTDGVHSATSRYYLGTAIDMRTWTTPESGVQMAEPRGTGLVAGLKAFLGRDWFVLDEGTHIHIDWRPRRKSQETIQPTEVVVNRYTIGS